MRLTDPLLHPFLGKRIVVSPDGCWMWGGPMNPGGYGVVCHEGKRVPAHRYTYEMAVGPIPSDKQIDHLCRVRACCNPAHLEVVTQRENTLRGVGLSAINARKTACHRGHELTGGNVSYYRSTTGGIGRCCLACKRAASLRYHARRRLKMRASLEEKADGE